MAKVNLVELYKSLNDKPLHEQGTYGDLSPEEWEAEREKMGMKTDDEGNMFIDKEYDAGNEPLEIQMTPDQGEYANKIFYIEPEDIEAYVNGEDVEATNPGEREYDQITANRQNSDVTGVSEEELEDFLVSGDRSADDIDYDVDDDDRFSGMDDMFGADLEERKGYQVAWDRFKKWLGGQSYQSQWAEEGGMDESFEMFLNEIGCTKEEIVEGTCGYGRNGKIGKKPASPSRKLQERFKKLANIK